MKRWSVTLQVDVPDTFSKDEVLLELINKGWNLHIVNVTSETVLCGKSVPNPNPEYWGSANCRQPLGHEGPCPWPWGGP